jgi:hypothetical protein
MTPAPGAVDLLWIPLGAGGHVVRLNGKVYEAIRAFIEHRPRCALFHSALEVSVPRWPVRHRVSADPRPARTRAWRRRRRPRRNEMGRTVPAVSLRDPPVAWRLHPRCEGCGLEPGPSRERPRSRATGPRPGSVRPDPGVGPRRAADGRDVELQLTDLVATRTCWCGNRADPAASRRSGAGLGCWPRHRPTRRRTHARREAMTAGSC